MNCYHTVCAQNRLSHVVEGANVYLVPYTDGSFDPQDAVELFTDEQGSSSVTSLLTDINGNASFWVAGGRYTTVVSKDGITSTYEVDDISCEGCLAETETQKTETTINGELVHNIPFTGDFVQVEIFDEDGDSIFPQCTENANSITLEYRADCAPVNHRVCITTRVPSDENTMECGYLGSQICPIPVITDTVTTQNEITVSFDFGDGVGSITLSQVDPGGSMLLISPASVVSDEIIIDLQTTGNGRVNYNVLIDKADLPTTGACFAPVSGELSIDGLEGGAGAAQIAKSIGGTVATQNLQAVLGNVYETITDGLATEFTDTVDPHHYAGDPMNTAGSNFTGSIQIFDGSNQQITIGVKTCYHDPVEAEFDSLGNYLVGYDSQGNEVLESDYRQL